jgi:beta-glucosidase
VPTDGELSYDEGLFIGYRAWRRAGAKPAYWFGEGLGYTEWAYEGLEARLGGGADALAEVSVRVRNTGARAGREVVQVYLAPDGVDRSRPDLQLAGFAVVEAAPGETVTARVTIARRAVQTWDTLAHAWVTRPGVYTVEAGRSVADRPLAMVLDVV